MPRMRRAALFCCCAVAGLACGGSPDEADTAPTERPRATSTPDPKLARCGLPEVRPDADQGAVPAELRPQGSQVSSSRRTGSAVTATVLLPLAMDAAYQALLAAAPKAGYEVAFSEFEGFDAEVYLRNEAGLAKFRLRPSKCPDASQALFQRVTSD